MRKSLVVGILKETKDWEWRAPLVPSDVKWLIDRGIKVEVQANSKRIFKDKEYKNSGAKLVDKFQKANLLIGIKEPIPHNLYPGKIYMVFSHISKGQLNNVPLLKACLEKKITLIDYEKIVDLHGKRIAYFGRFAGICGAVDSLHYLGKKLEGQGIKNPFTLIQPAYQYSSLEAVKKAMARVYGHIQSKGLDKRLSPFIIGITGHGNVSRGVQEILASLNPVEIHPRDMLQFVQHQKAMRGKIYKIVFLREEKFRVQDGRGFYFEEYLKQPKKFESNLDVYLPYLNILLHTSYWDSRYPRMVTKKMVQDLSRKKPFRLEFIGDISCDINGSIELTYKTTSPANPTFTYQPKKKKFVEGYIKEGITVLAVDNLPSELPKDASLEFSFLIRDYVYQIAAHGIRDVTCHAALPAEIRRAVIVEGGKFSRGFNYLKQLIS